jgi:glycosyltransferase involved in cell wall biosynthesis
MIDRLHFAECPTSVSVVIPCFNAEAFLEETIQSVLAQTHQPNEIIVVDDGSTDRSREIARSFGKAIRFFEQTNQGVSVARNRGIEASLSHWIAFLDADDLWHPKKLEEQLALCSLDTMAVYSDIEVFGDTEKMVRLSELSHEERHQPARLAKENLYLTPSALLVRRDLTLRFPEWTCGAEDFVYMLELVQTANVEIVPLALTRYRKHAGGLVYPISSLLNIHRTIHMWLEQGNHPLDDTEKNDVQSA